MKTIKCDEASRAYLRNAMVIRKKFIDSIIIRI